MYKNNRFFIILDIRVFTVRYGLNIKRIIVDVVFENRVLRRIFGPKWEEVTVE
jgi:hypothetical protein